MTASRCSSGHAHTQKMSDCIMSQDQGASGKNGSPGSNTHVDQPTDWVLSITYVQRQMVSFTYI